jgi:hypothetical protein
MNITLDVGGQIFKTTYDTLIKIQYFKNMFDGCNRGLDEIIFVNRSPNIFAHVFALIIDPLHPYPKKYAYELDFYGIDYSNITLYDKKQEIIDEMNEKLDTLLSYNTHRCKYSGCQIKVQLNKKYCTTHWKYGNYCNINGCSLLTFGGELCKEHR